MMEFFKGWRRKLGCALLLMALALMGAWIRSRLKFDFFDLNLGQTTFRAGSHGNSLRVMALSPRDNTELFQWASGDLQSLGPYNPNASREDREEFSNIIMDWRWSFQQFHAGRGTYPRGDQITCFVMPYWSIVIPLTLMSAYLLIRKPKLSTGENRLATLNKE